MGRPTLPKEAGDLPAAEAEVRAVGALFPGSAQLYTGAEATEARAKATMEQVRYIHFATHGLASETAPMYSAIALARSGAEDGMLYARELLDMKLSADLVVLSACETGLGQEVRGEGILGLTWALFVAGAPSSVVSQWSVADASTSRLMVTFYEGLRSARVSKAEALRQAQLRLMRNGRHGHPLYWAPFVLVGEWRNR